MPSEPRLLAAPPRRVPPPGRGTNVALLVVLVGAFVTGGLAFAAARPPAATMATVAHGCLGLAVVALMPWKSVIIARARRLPVASLALLGLLVISLVAGFVQMLAGYGFVLGLSPIQVHVGAAIGVLVLLVWHVLRRRRQRLRRTDLSRRRLLRGGLVTLGVGAGFAALAGVAEASQGPARRRTSTGSRPLPAATIPATTWLLDQVPRIDGVAHRVLVDGAEVSVGAIAARSGPVPARLDCTSGWYADATWTGTRLSDLIPASRLAQAVSLEVRSATGYRRRFPVREAGSLWLAVAVEGQPLRAGTGAPVRLVAPSRRGFWWVKWVAAVELSDRPSWWQLPFPPQ